MQQLGCKAPFLQATDCTLCPPWPLTGARTQLNSPWSPPGLETEHRGRRHSRDKANRTDTEQWGTDRVVLRPQPQPQREPREPSCIFTAVRRKVCLLTPTASGVSHCSHHHPVVNEWTDALVPCQTLTFLSRRDANTEYQQSLWPFFFLLVWVSSASLRNYPLLIFLQC